MPPVLGYWKTRCLGQPIRYLLAYCGVEFEDKMYEQGEAPDFSRESWYREKLKLGLDLPNLPYYIDGDVNITESNAILRYIARQHDLCGTTEMERVRVDMIGSTAYDCYMKLCDVTYSEDFEKLKQGYLDNFPAKLKMFSDFLGSNHFFAGNDVTFPDFQVYELLWTHILLQPICLDEFPSLQAFCTRVEDLPAIKAYRASPKCTPLPCHSKKASWGGTLPE